MLATTRVVGHPGTSIIGTALHPIFVLVGYVLAYCYEVVPNYAAAIAILTIIVMIIVFPLTRASARSMMRMQLLAPEMKRIQARYKAKPGAPAAEKQELRQKMNEEVMALYREHKVNPTGGCLPMFLQFPILIVLYDVVRGLSKQTTELVNGKTMVVSTPQNIPHTSRMYHDLVLASGQMHALGINLADSVRTHQPHLVGVIPYALLVLAAVGLQYVSIWQVTTRNPAASQANAQMQQMQKFMPLIFLVLYIALPAGVGVYFIVSSLFRVAQQEWMYKRDPTITKAINELRRRTAADPPAEKVAGAKVGFLARLREAGEIGSGSSSSQSGPATPRQPRSGAKGPAPTTKATPAKRAPSAQGSNGNGSSKPNPAQVSPAGPAATGNGKPAGENGSSPSTSAARPRPGAKGPTATPPTGASGSTAKPQPRARDKRQRRGR